MIVEIQTVAALDGTELGVACVQDERGYVTVVRTGAPGQPAPEALRGVELPWRLPRPVQRFACGWLRVLTVEDGGLGEYDVIRRTGGVYSRTRSRLGAESTWLIATSQPDPKETLLLYSDGAVESLSPGIQRHWSASLSAHRPLRALVDHQPCAITADDRLVCSRGGPATEVLSSVQEAVVDGWGAHGCVLKKDGSVWCWGSNMQGELGTGPWSAVAGGVIGGRSDVPVEVPGLGRVVHLARRGRRTCAQLAGDHQGEVWCWGPGVTALGAAEPVQAFPPCTERELAQPSEGGGTILDHSYGLTAVWVGAVLRSDGSVRVCPNPERPFAPVPTLVLRGVERMFETDAFLLEGGGVYYGHPPNGHVAPP